MFYNLLVSANSTEWDSGVSCIYIDRFCTYTDCYTLSFFPDEKIKDLMNYPCIFAYEKNIEKNPKYGYIKEMTFLSDNTIKITYDILNVDTFISHGNLLEFAWALDIKTRSYDHELNRTHWAIKNIDLHKFLLTKNIIVPSKISTKPVDITKHDFDVALTFPGEVRDKVEPIAKAFRLKFGENTIFYDKFYVSQLARPNCDTVLQNIYKSHSKLIIMFLCNEYKKEWCGLEFRAIKDIIKCNDDHKIMFIKVSDFDNIAGVFSIDGYIDINEYTTDKIVEFIEQRLSLLK